MVCFATADLAEDAASFIFSPELPWEEQSPQKLPPLNGTGIFYVSSWSPDGRWLAGDDYQTESRIVLFSISSQEYRILPVEGYSPVWLSDSRRLLYVNQGKIYMLDSESGSTHEVLSVTPDTAGHPRLSRDDRWIYFSCFSFEADIWMLTLNEER